MLMVERKDLLSLNFYKKTPFYGSLKNMNYKIEAVDKGDDGKILRVVYWPGPYNFDTTPDTLKQESEFPYSEEGLCCIADFLNSRYDKQKELFS